MTDPGKSPGRNPGSQGITYASAGVDIEAGDRAVALFNDPGIVVHGVAPSKEMAEEVAMIATRQMFYARLPQVKGTAGGVAFLLDVVMPASPAYRWTLNHTMRLDDPLELFPTFVTEAGV